MGYMNEKKRKTLYVPVWIDEFLDAEGKIYEGPGTVVATAIFCFKNMPPKAKIKAIQDYKVTEVSLSYDEDRANQVVTPAVNDAGGQVKRQGKHKEPKAS